jgi:hypothetical protein
MPGCPAQVPHAIVPPSGAPDWAEQSPLWHCESDTHCAAAASVPAVKLHGPWLCCRTPQPDDLMADTQVSSALAVMLTPGRASVDAQSWAKRGWVRAISLAGGARLPWQLLA